jgi:23S rRNA pseudouridine1911/1915/1917 synthase
MKQKYTVLFEDDDYVAIDKPSGVLIIPDRFNKELDNLQSFLNNKYGKIYTAHRIDKQTSGVIVFAKNADAHAHLNNQFTNHTVWKKYVALVHGITPPHGTINFKIFEDPQHLGRMDCSYTHGKDSLTTFETIKSYKQNISYVAAYPQTGRTHQIRVHFLAIDHPLVIDELYSTANGIFLSQLKKKYKLSKLQEEEMPIMNRLTLHAAEIKFINTNNIEQTVVAPLPKDFQAVITQLEKNQ